MGQPDLKVKRIGTGMPVEDLAHAARQEMGTYMRRISEDERTTLHTSVVEVAKQDEALSEERTATMADLRERGKSIKSERRRLLKAITTGQLEEAGTLYYFPDADELRMRIYNAKGELIEDRRMTADEAQLRIND